MKYAKPSSLYKYAKRLRQSILGVDLGKSRSGVCVSEPYTGSIFPARSPVDGAIFSFKHNTEDRAADIFEFATSLNVLAEHYNAAGYNFGYPYDKWHLNNPDLGSVVRQHILDLNFCRSWDGYFLLESRYFTVVNEEFSSKFGSNLMLMDYFKNRVGFKDWSPELYAEYVQFLSSPAEVPRINYLEMMRLDAYAAVQFSRWYFNYISSTGSSKLNKKSPNEWDGDYKASQRHIQKVIRDLGFVAHDI